MTVPALFFCGLLHKGFNSTVSVYSRGKSGRKNDDDKTLLRILSSSSAGNIEEASPVSSGVSAASSLSFSSQMYEEEGEDVEGKKTDVHEDSLGGISPGALVVKRIHRAKCSSGEFEQNMREVEFLRKITPHPNILPLLSHCSSEEALWLVFDHAPLGDLHQFVKTTPLTEESTRTVIRQILRALEHTHSFGVVHGDIKPHNCLVFPHDSMSPATATSDGGVDWNNAIIKLCDFGLARSLGNGRTLQFEGVKGTHNFIAPELLMHKDYDAKIDLWAIGVMTFQLLVNFEPFYPTCTCLTETVEFEDRYWGTISAEAKDFIRSLLMRNPILRPTATEALQHPFLH